MTPEEQQYQWLRNIAALKSLGLQPSDLFKSAHTELGGIPGFTQQQQQIRKDIPPPKFSLDKHQSLTESDIEETDWKLAVGQALTKMLLGANQPTKPVAPYRATPPTLR